VELPFSLVTLENLSEVVIEVILGWIENRSVENVWIKTNSLLMNVLQCKVAE